MWFYVQMALPLLTVGLAAAICLTVTSFIVGHAQPHLVHFSLVATPFVFGAMLLMTGIHS